MVDYRTNAARTHKWIGLQKEDRMVINDGLNWFLDPNPQKLNLLGRFWIMKRNLNNVLVNLGP